MKSSTKSLKCRLIDMLTREQLAEGIVDISLFEPTDITDRPQYTAIIELIGYRPELDNRNIILELNDIISGEVFVTITGIPNTRKTRFKVFLQDPRWNSLEWFNSV